MTLVILAAGMGSRFGGLKQIEPVGKNGEFIIDYSIYDAIKCGFTKVVFIIKEENYEIFRETVGKRVEDKIKVEYVFQKNDNVPAGINIPITRVKPLGTAHAILCCKDVVNEPFAIINADDFYGFDAYKVISEFLRENNSSNCYAMAGYYVGNTITENGAVKRGICRSNGDYLTELVESSVERNGSRIIATPLDGRAPFEVPSSCLVSMNLFAFKPEIFDYLEERFKSFLEENKDLLDTCEYLIPTVVFEQIKKGKVTCKILKTDAVWHGMTYKEDKNELTSAIDEMIKDNIYPEKLWD